MSNYFSKISGLFFVLMSIIILSGCATPLADAKLYTTEPVKKIVPADPNTIYYGVKWAMDECSYPMGQEDLSGGVIESKWVPIGATTHYVELFNRKDYGANGAYYKMIVQISPLGAGKSEVKAYTKVKSLANNIKSDGEAERKILSKILEHSRGYDITLTNLGVEE